MIEAIVTPQMYPKVFMNAKAAAADATSASGSAAIIAGRRTERIRPHPALAISSKTAQAALDEWSSSRVYSPKPIADNANAVAWRGR